MNNKIISLAAVSMLLASCVSYKPKGTVLPQGNGVYKLIMTGNTESIALRLSAEDAQGVCKDNGKRQYRIESQDSRYIGVKLDSGEGAGIGGTSMTLLQVAADHNHKENYKVETLFTCL